MIAARYTQGGSFAVNSAPVPPIGEDEMLLRVEAASICGTDLKIVRNGHRKLRDGQTVTLGHEFVGTIEKLGSAVSGYTAGQRVGIAPNWGCGQCAMCLRGMGNMCPDYSAFGINHDGAHAEFVRVPAAVIRQGNVIPMAADVSATAAALAEPLSCAVSGVRNARIAMGDVVVVYGAGPMGMLCMMLAARQGPSKVVAVDVNRQRLEAARRAGATAVVDTSSQKMRDWVAVNAPGGVDVVILATPVPQLQGEALEILAPFGRLCLFAGWAKGQGAVPLDTNPIHYRNLIVTGMTGACNADYLTALRLIGSGAVDVGVVVSRIFPMSEMAAAYDAALSGRELKVVISAAAEGRP